MRYILLLLALLPACIDGELITYTHCADVDYILGCKADGCDVILSTGSKAFIYGKPPLLGDACRVYSSETKVIGVVDSECRRGR